MNAQMLVLVICAESICLCYYIICLTVPLNVDDRTSVKVHLYIGCLFLPLTSLFLVTFPITLAQVFRRYRSTSLQKASLHNFLFF